MKKTVIAAAVAMVPFLASAQHPGSAPPADSDGRTSYGKHLVGDMSSGWAWETAGLLTGTGLGSYALYRWVDSEIDRKGAPLADSAGLFFSDIGTYTPFAVPIAFLSAGLLQPAGTTLRGDLLMTTEQLGEALFFTAVTTFSLKYGIRRDRPDGSDSRSFPSAHASLNFATAGVIFHRYPWYIGVPSLALASAISVSRVDRRKHYPSDVLAGAGIGFLFASLVHAYHVRFDRKPLPVMPLTGNGTYGLEWVSFF